MKNSVRKDFCEYPNVYYIFQIYFGCQSIKIMKNWINEELEVFYCVWICVFGRISICRFLTNVQMWYEIFFGGRDCETLQLMTIASRRPSDYSCSGMSQGIFLVKIIWLRAVKKKCVCKDNTFVSLFDFSRINNICMEKIFHNHVFGGLNSKYFMIKTLTEE